MQHSGPLWAAVEDVYGSESMGEGYTRPFCSFYRLAVELKATSSPASLYNCKPNNKPMYLTSTQTRSFWMLWRWWKIYQNACLMDVEKPTEDFYIHLVAGVPYQLNVNSRHFLEGLSLFEREFGGPTHYIEDLEVRREELAIQSACQHIALACYLHLGKKKTKSQEFWIHSADLIFQDFGAVFEGGRRIIQEQELSGLDPRCSTGASVIACPWLEDSSGLPFYLWSVAAKEVVETSILPPNIEYTAISHTWGRWQKDKPIHVPGVKGWAVPQNTIFDVGDLPSILEKVPTSTPYIWFDLLCIPQDRSPRAAQEISRQAQIFRRAKHAIIWLNRLSSWKGVEDTLDWMSLVYLFEDDLADAKVRNIPTGLFNDYEYESDTPGASMEVTGWFSSLWTLQEICLRPDMWLCNAEWSLLCAGKGTPVGFNGVVALTQKCTQVLEGRVSRRKLDAAEPQFNLTTDLIDPAKKFGMLVQHGKYQRGFLELVELFDRTGMKDLHTMKRDAILLLGSQRYCEGSREEAIMAVLGASDWNSSLPAVMESTFNNENLVHGQYPLGFVQYVATALGATFFNSLSTCSKTIDFADIIANAPQWSRGSLLPFGHTQMESQEKKLLLNWVFPEAIQNQTIETWRVQSSGSVHVPMAAIIISTTDVDKEDAIGNIWLTYDAGRYNEPDPRFSRFHAGMRRMTVNLRTWAREYYPFSRNFVVELFSSNGSSRGVLLKEIRWGSNQLVKVGNYMTVNHFGNMPDDYRAVVKSVDWIVV